MLAELVRQGKLPPVEERLPDNPPVVEPVERIGKYGGTWRRLAITRTDSLMISRLGYEPLVRWDRSGRRVVPGIAESWEVKDGGRTYIFHLRKGMKWSDGHPFTSEDILFWYEDEVLNKELTPVKPTWLMPHAGDFEVLAPDELTVIFRFDIPNGLCPEFMAFRGHYIYQPKHYMKQFHIRYADPKVLERQAREAGLDFWHQLYRRKADLHENPDLPTIRPWKIKVGPPATRYIAERNPYYWKVDPEGNQLPYIDRISFTVVQNTEVLNLKAMSGEVDMQARYIDPSKYTLFMDPVNRKMGNYRVLVNDGDGPSCIFINQYSKNPELRPILQDRRFRIALSVAINRPELVELVYGGLATPSRAVSGPQDPYFLPEFNEKYIEYDPSLANRLLDEVGLRRGPDGMRRLPSGRKFRPALYCFPSHSGAGPDMLQLVVDYWREVGLDFTLNIEAATLSVMRASNGNTDFWAYQTEALHWEVDPLWYVPMSPWSYYAPLYGRYHATGGRSGVKPSPEFQRLIDWYTEMSSVTDESRRLELGRRILRQWSEECYIIGLVLQKQLTIVSNRFKNCPDHIIHNWQLMTPGYIDVEQFYIDEEASDAHATSVAER